MVAVLIVVTDHFQANSRFTDFTVYCRHLFDETCGLFAYLFLHPDPLAFERWQNEAACCSGPIRPK